MSKCRTRKKRTYSFTQSIVNLRGMNFGPFCMTYRKERLTVAASIIQWAIIVLLRETPRVRTQSSWPLNEIMKVLFAICCVTTCISSDNEIKMNWWTFDKRNQNHAGLHCMDCMIALHKEEMPMPMPCWINVTNKWTNQRAVHLMSHRLRLSS